MARSIARSTRFLAPAALAGLALWTTLAAASDAGAGADERRADPFEITIKATGLVSRAPDDMALYPVRDSASSLWRMRLTYQGRPAEGVRTELAYEQRARLQSEGAGAAGAAGLLPSAAEAPYRLTQLDWLIADAGETYAYRHEIDRASVSFDLELAGHRGRVTLGRQAVGMGRGVIFGAVDVFAPFSPLEVDRDWRRGVDAARADFALTDTTSFDVTAAFGADHDHDAVVARLRGYSPGSGADGELIVGRRARDWMYAGVFSRPVGGAEAHCELAVFEIPEHAGDGELFGADHLTARLVIGGSYNFAGVGEGGLKVFAEYHYSGFGVAHPQEILTRLQDPQFLRRFLRGDTQILGRHALAGQLSYPFTDTLTGTFLLLTSPADGSGVAAPSVRYDLADNATLLGSLFVPWGAGPRFGELQSEYGATPISLFLQAAIYY